MIVNKPIKFNLLFVYCLILSISFIFLFFLYKDDTLLIAQNALIIIDIIILLSVIHLEYHRKKAYATYRLFFKEGLSFYIYTLILILAGWIFILLGAFLDVSWIVLTNFSLVLTQIGLFVFIFLYIRQYSTYIESTRLYAPHYVLIGFIGLIILGAFLLFQPFSQRVEEPFINSLFTATSAVCVTGLVVNNISTSYSQVGLTILLALIQFGGLGIMVLYASFMLFFSGNISIQGFNITTKAIDIPEKYKSFQQIIFFILIYTFVIEFIGALILTLRFLYLGFSVGNSIISAIFHSISAFCNAGFSLYSTNFMGFKTDFIVNITLICLITFGGIGFMVAYDLFNYFAQKFGRNKKVVYINPQTKIVLSMYLILNFTGMILFFIFENAKSLNGLYPHEKFLASLFQVVTARTAGFNTLDIASLQPITKLLLEVLMIIGANSGSTGGGIKVSTFFIILSTVFAFIGEKEHVNINRRRISYNNIVKSFSLFFSYLSVVVIALGLILLLDIFDFEKVLFEVISAMGTVGLSCGITPYLKSSSKLVIVVLMFIGRVGPLTFFTALNLSKKNEKVTYPETEIMIG